MTRWAVAGLTATILTQTGFGQSLWPAGAKQSSSAPAVEERIVTMRTAGQPDRRVKVLRTEITPDGTQFTEMKDLATGAVYSIMGPPPAADPFPSTATTAPGEKLVPVNDAALPQAKPRPADPLLGAQANLGTKSNSVAAAAGTGIPANAPPVQTRLAAALFGAGTPTPQPVANQQVVKQPVPPQAGQHLASRPEPKQSAFSKAMFGEWGQSAPQAVAVAPRSATPAQTTVAAKPTVPTSVANRTPVSAPVVAVAPRPAEPKRSAPVVAVAPRTPETAPPVLAAPTPQVYNPNTVVAAAPRKTEPIPPPPVLTELPPQLPTGESVAVVAPKLTETLPVLTSAPPAMTEAVAARPTAPAETPAPPALVAANVKLAKKLDSNSGSTEAVTQVSATVESETTGLLHQLANHSKPSGRIAAAMALAELPTVSRPEVVQSLVAAAESDTVGVVRGNCILLLNAMGYAHPEYVAMLRNWEADEEPAVRSAVRVALSKVR